MTEVSVVDYGIGNTGSICNMFRKLRIEADVVSTEQAVLRANRLILPGIGAFDACMGALDSSGLRASVLHFAATQRPLLGICVGMQMLTLASEEGNSTGLGLICARTRRFSGDGDLRIPHMGWNTVKWSAPEHPLARGLAEDCRFYFVHSYRVICDFPANSLADCSYGGEFSAAIGSGNISGVQFHPEKSHRFGLQLLRNFALS